MSDSVFVRGIRFGTALAMVSAVSVFTACDNAGDSSASQPSEAAPQSSTPAEPRTDVAVVDAFNAYRLNASAGMGAEALGYVHSSYFDLVQGQLDAIRDADRETLEAMPFFDRYIVLSSRFRVDHETLRTITPREFAQLAIEQGWMSEEAMRRALIESVELLPEGSSEPDRAEITMSLGGHVSPATLPMLYEDGRWLVDLANLAKRGSEPAERMAELMGEDADAIILRGLAAKEGKPVPDDIYEPVGRN